MILPVYARGGNGLPAERVVHAAYCRAEPAAGCLKTWPADKNMNGPAGRTLSGNY